MHFYKLSFSLLVVLIYIVSKSSGALFFPRSSTHGVFAAIAVPLGLPHREVFVSYNFEANYNSPYTWDIPPVFNGVEEDEEFVSETERKLETYCKNCSLASSRDRSEAGAVTKTDSEEKDGLEADVEATTPLPSVTEERRKKRSLLSRSNFYHILRNKFQRSGFSGEACLLRLICETNTSSELGSVNGVLGSIMHIIFSPSSSENEGLSLSYYQAEYDGLHDSCQHYESDCQESIFDIISQPLEEILKQIESNKL